MGTVTKNAMINYNGRSFVLNVSDEKISLENEISRAFGINISSVQSMFVQDSKERSYVPFNLTNLSFGHKYDLHIKFKKENAPGHQNLHNGGNNSQNSNYNMQDSEYFSGYSNLMVHKTMLQDKARTGAYEEGIKENKEKIEGKTVLDVGTGTGILSIFAAKNGAEKVFSVDASPMARDAKRIVSENSLEDKISVIEGKIEDIVLPCDSVDVIISEWMGSMLLFESMLVSIINARDRYLSPEGLMLPSGCRMVLAPLNVPEFVREHVGFWDDVHGVDMSSLREKAMAEFFSYPIFTSTIKPDGLMGEEKTIFTFDTKTVQERDIENILSTFSFEIEKNGDLHGFGCWFDVSFGKTVLSTSPDCPETHWKQTMFVFDDYPLLKKGDTVNGIISIVRNNQWGRHYEITLKYRVEGTPGYYQKKFPLPMAPQ